MTRLAARAVVVAAALAAMPAILAGGQAGSVLIDAVAFDKSGAPVLDLTPQDLDVRINQFRVPVESVELVTPASEQRGNRIVILLMDDITLPLAEVPRAQEVARRFVSRMAPGDTMAVVRLNDPALESTDEPAALRRAIDRYSVQATGVLRSDQLGAHVLGTIGSIARGLREAGDGRKVIVGIGSGWLFDRPIPPPNSGTGNNLLPEWIDCMKALSGSHATFYAIDPSGVGNARGDGGDSGFARETGGHAFISTNDLNGAADRILRETSNYYLIHTANPPTGGSGLRELEIRSVRRGVTIRARRAIH